MRTSVRGALPALFAWTVALAIATLGMLAVRSHLGQAHVALLFLLVVLAGSAAGGRMVGLWLAAASFLLFDWFFLPPYGTFFIANPLDWLVLVTYLVTSIVAAQLLYRAQAEARAARERAEEIDHLATLGAETLNLGRAEEALAAIAAVIREATQATSCEVFTSPSGDGAPALSARAAGAGAGEASAIDPMVGWVAANGAAVLQRRDGTTRLGTARPGEGERALLAAGQTTALLLPLQVQGRTVGVLRVARDNGLYLDAERLRFLDAISYYAALGVERVRLSAAAEHAEALREADRLKDALIASVSHDLRTPLTTIKALAHDLRTLGDERTEIIEQEADRLNRLVADLLDLSRLSAGALPVRIELNAVDDLLGALVQQVEPSLGGARLEVTLPPEAPVLLGRFDFVHSLRILANLVSNAAKYAPRHSPVEIVASRDRASLLVSVADRGPGVPPDEADRIFEPFYRAPGVPPDVGGAGLGLSIARQLAEAQGGALTYAPRAGGGSVFTLRLPVANEAEEAFPGTDPESS